MLALRNWNGDGASVGTNMTRRANDDPHKGKTRRARWQWLFVPRTGKTGEMTQKAAMVGH
jgi:hypothetical protein